MKSLLRYFSGLSIAAALMVMPVALGAQSTVHTAPPVDIYGFKGLLFGASLGAASGWGEAYAFTTSGYALHVFAGAEWESVDEVRFGFGASYHNDPLMDEKPMTVINGSMSVLWAVHWEEKKVQAGPTLGYLKVSGTDLRDLSGWGVGGLLSAQWRVSQHLSLQADVSVLNSLFGRPWNSGDLDGIAPGSMSALRIGTVYHLPVGTDSTDPGPR